MPNIDLLKVRLPSNFDADAILSGEKMNATKRENLKAAMYYILSTLYEMSLQRRYKEIYEEYGGYPMNSKIMNNLLGKRYVEALYLLEKHDVIIRSEGYQVGVQSKLIRLSEKHSVTGVKFRQIKATASISKKILAQKELLQLQNNTALKKIPFVTKWFDPARLSVNENTVHGFIEFYRSELIGRIPEKLPKGRTREEITSRINQRVNSMLDTMESFRRGEMRLSKTGKDHRLHSFLSNTKKELRTLYLFDEKPLVSIDLRSSQPYLLNYLLNPENWEKVKNDVLPELQPLLHLELEEQLSSILMFGGFEAIDVNPDIKKFGFSDISWEDDFYSMLVERAREEQMSDVFPDRAVAKRAIMMILFDEGWYKDKSKEFKLFLKWFPLEANLILFIKKLSRDISFNEEGFTTGANILPILLQRIESKIILEDVCSAIKHQLPDAPLLPVHDCIHTTEEYAEEVADIIKRELTKIIGMTPGIMVEKYNPQNTMNGLTKLAEHEMFEIIRYKSKTTFLTKIKPPFLLTIPENDFDMLISDRYITPDWVDDGLENIIHLIDDRTKIKQPF